MKRSRSSYVYAGVIGTMGLAFGCNQILGAGDYHVGDAGEVGGDGATGDGGASEAGADACAPGTSKTTFESACTGSACTPFDNGRVTLGRDLPPFTKPDGGTSGGLPDAGSLPLCSSLPGVVYATGSTALLAFIGKVAQVLEQTKSETLVYQSSGSCVGVNDVLNPASNLMNGIAFSFDPNAPDPTAAAAQIPCSLEPDGVQVDIGISDVFASTCITGGLPQGLPAGVQENFGPVQVMEFIVPATSQQTSISAEAAHDVYGFGKDSKVDPWVDDTLIFQRTSSSGTQNMIAAAIGVPAVQWFGVQNSSSGGMRDALKAAGLDTTKANKAIGILASDIADDNRDTLKPLAYQDRSQACGYYPDSSADSLDKKNVRDGHYPIWGPSHFYARVNSAGVPPKAGAADFISDITGVSPLPGVDLLTLYATRHLVPLCAMKVTRDTDGADYTPFTPKTGCSCYYEKATASLDPSCKSCTQSSDCPASAPNCNMFGTPAVGFCEP